MKEFTPQVEPNHYIGGYDHKARWLAYFYQISLIRESGASRMLEVGPGNGTVSAYLRRQGIEVTTVDIDPKLNPDVVASVTALPFKEGMFDAAMACEVLEHLPFEYFVPALRELARVSRKYVVISLPDARHSLLYLALKIPFVREISLRLRLSKRTAHRFDGEHYWEIGKKGSPVSIVRAAIGEAGLLCEREFTSPDAPYYRFFILRK